MEWNADLYDRNSSLQFRVGQVAIERLNPQDCERILEIGCGLGRLTGLIAQKIPNGEIIAIDREGTRDDGSKRTHERAVRLLRRNRHAI